MPLQHKKTGTPNEQEIEEKPTNHERPQITQLPGVNFMPSATTPITGTNLQAFQEPAIKNDQLTSSPLNTKKPRMSKESKPSTRMNTRKTFARFT